MPNIIKLYFKQIIRKYYPNTFTSDVTNWKKKKFDVHGNVSEIFPEHHKKMCTPGKCEC